MLEASRLMRQAKPRTHESLAVRGRAVTDNLPDVVLESFVEHPVGLIENEVRDTGESNRASILSYSGRTRHSTYLEKSTAPSLTRSRTRPGVPTTTLRPG